VNLADWGPTTRIRLCPGTAGPTAEVTEEGVPRATTSSGPQPALLVAPDPQEKSAAAWSASHPLPFAAELPFPWFFLRKLMPILLGSLRRCLRLLSGREIGPLCRGLFASTLSQWRFLPHCLSSSNYCVFLSGCFGGACGCCPLGKFGRGVEGFRPSPYSFSRGSFFSGTRNAPDKIYRSYSRNSMSLILLASVSRSPGSGTSYSVPSG